MKSKTTIQFEFQQVMSQASALEDSALELQNVRAQINTLVDSLRAGWVGESAELYFQKCNELAYKLNTSQKNLDKVADVIRKSAKAYRDAELAAIQVVQD